MSKTVVLKIDVTKIDKARLFEGQKGTYLDAIVFIDDEQDKYGNNGMIVQSVKQEEREAGIKGNILGNCKIIGGGAKSTKYESEESNVVKKEGDDDLPF